MRSHINTLALGAAGVVLLTACGGSTSPYGGGGGGGHSPNLTVRNYSFSPTPDTVTAGTAVTFTWAVGSVDHNVTSDTGPTSPPNSATMAAGPDPTPAPRPGPCTGNRTTPVNTNTTRGTDAVTS